VPSGNSASSRVRLTPIRRQEIDAALFARALIAAQLLEQSPEDTEPPTSNARKSRKEQSS